MLEIQNEIGTYFSHPFTHKQWGQNPNSILGRKVELDPTVYDEQNQQNFA